jgi:RecB family exonuclease
LAQPLQERHLSAMALNTFMVCPLRFRYRYIDNLYWSRQWGGSPEERKALEKGQNFHLMARRYYSGLEPAQVADPVEQTELESWLQLMAGFLPRAFDRQYYPELDLRLNRPDLKLMAKFDLVVVDPDGRATIYDWKTEKKMPAKTYLQKSAQTLVYRYMLCAAGGQYSPKGRFKPEDVSMVYWNPLYPHRPVHLEYSDAQFQKDEEYLRREVAKILHTDPDMFRGTPDQGVCRRCEYMMICHGRRAEAVDADDEEALFEATLSWDDLPDLP